MATKVLFELEGVVFFDLDCGDQVVRNGGVGEEREGEKSRPASDKGEGGGD